MMSEAGKGPRCTFPSCGKTGEHLIPIPGLILRVCRGQLELAVFIIQIIEARARGG